MSTSIPEEFMGKSSTTPLSLPAPESSEGTKKLAIDQTIKLDELGPMVVNSDGTLSRISNWKNMTTDEKDRIVRVLGARNKLRIANEEKKLQNLSSASTEAYEGASDQSTAPAS